MTLFFVSLVLIHFLNFKDTSVEQFVDLSTYLFIYMFTYTIILFRNCLFHFSKVIRIVKIINLKHTIHNHDFISGNLSLTLVLNLKKQEIFYKFFMFFDG